MNAPALIDDFRAAVRQLHRTKGFSMLAILSVGAAIGATTIVFSVVSAVLLRPLPYGQPERLVTVWQDLRGRGGPADEWATPGNYVDWRREKDLFDGLAVITGWRPTMTGSGEAEPLTGEVLLAVADGRPVAAMSVDDGRVAADPFERTGEAVALLRPEDQALVRMLASDPPASYAEISAALDMPIGSIGPTRARCLERLRARCEQLSFAAA